MSKTTSAKLARDLLDSFVNGNRNYVRVIIAGLTPRQAASVAFYMRDYTDEHNVSALGRLLEHDVYEFDDPIR